MSYFIIGFILVVALSETILRLVYHFKNATKGGWRRFLLAPNSWRSSRAKVNFYSSHPYISFVKKRHVKSLRFPTNSLGYVGQDNIDVKKTRKIRVYVCGDSTVEQNDYDMQAPFDPMLTWPSVMSSQLNLKFSGQVEVINAGVTAYTSMESMIEFQLRGVYLQLDYAIFQQNLTDAWFCQSTANFKEDYSHVRLAANFPAISKLPDIPISYLYQYLKKRNSNYQDSLLGYLLDMPFETNFDNPARKHNVFRNNVRNFCRVAVAHGVVPIIVPWRYIPRLAKTPYGHREFSNEQLGRFKNLLDVNNRILEEVCVEFEKAVFLDPGVFSNNHFREFDWIHWSKDGLVEMGKRMADLMFPVLSEEVDSSELEYRNK